ncbi:MAG: diacylglycerol O-acyltransferase / wax synthase [Solirubrobacteraceae bacterium]|nr:diacylglycerol O-acyltransferase / wax synthase [Solirubrobacteraceae bacterium]
MHVAVVSLGAGRPDAARLRRTVDARLARVPRFRQVIARVPLDVGRPVWVDDVTFDLSHHLRHIALPAPGDEAQLREFCDRMAGEPLDPTRPLWELWIVEGVAPDRFALVSKVHPLLADGVGSPEITDKLFSAEPDEPIGTMPEWRAREEPNGWRLAVDGALEAAGNVVMAGLRGRVFTAPARGLLRVGDVRRLASRRPAGPFDAAAASRDRDVAWLSVPLAELGEARHIAGATVNEVLLTGIAEGLSCWLSARATKPATGRLRILLPLTTSLRAERGALGSRVSGVVPLLPVGEMTAAERLARVSAAVEEAIGRRVPAPAIDISAMGTFAPPTLLAQAARLQWNAPAFDVSVTNAPGPAEPRYCGGSEILEVRPIMPLGVGRSLSVAAVSYNGTVSIGLTADPGRIPDLDDLAAAMAAGFERLRIGKRKRRAA